jgi:hypothetical protein
MLRGNIGVAACADIGFVDAGVQHGLIHKQGDLLTGGIGLGERLVRVAIEAGAVGVFVRGGGRQDRQAQAKSYQAQGRNPKPEGRKKPEARRPKAEPRRENGSRPSQANLGSELLGLTRISVFGLLSDFGLRGSDFAGSRGFRTNQ